jgi:hypothetical protein
MAKLTPQQVLGNKFEVWLEELYSGLGKRGVRRNVVYHRSRYAFRQVDVEYRDFHIINSLVIVEAKYLKKDKLRPRVRRKKKKTGQRIKSIDTILEEVEERRRFVKARKAIIVTNNDYTKSFYEEAERFGRIELYTMEDLEKLEKKRRGAKRFFVKGMPIEKQIRGVSLRKYDLSPTREYI